MDISTPKLADKSSAERTETVGSRYRLPSAARVGRVRLAVSELELSIRFYTRVIGLEVIERGQTRDGLLARLGVDGRVLLELEERPGVDSIGQRSRLGLYHTAFLLPTRQDLGAFVQHLRKLGIRFGAGDHLVSEAIYLADPDGLQVEVYADRPRDTWGYEGGQVLMGTEPVRFDELPVTGPWVGAPLGTTVGHVHLYVDDLEKAERFYVRGLGLDVMTRSYPGALFTSAGGYHHHVGLNVWAAGSPMASKADARLLFWELVVGDDAEIDRVAEGLIESGYREVVTTHGARGFVDDVGICVGLVGR